MTEVLGKLGRHTSTIGHARWVRVAHWMTAASFVVLVFSGFIILMAHPRLYWGEVGNDLTPALLELPISRNHQHGGWEMHGSFFAESPAVLSASRTYDIFNENGWGRSLHFLAGWCLVLTGGCYMTVGFLTGHFRRHLWPGGREIAPRLLWQDVLRHLRLRVPPATGGPQYGLLQKIAYCLIVFVVVPVIVLTGLAMSPAITAAYPILSAMSGGFQSARTIHFFASVALLVFAALHVAMVIRSGFRRQMLGMILGR